MKALVVPADLTFPMGEVNDHHYRTFVPGAEAFDFVTIRRGKFQIALDDAGIKKNLPHNRRAEAALAYYGYIGSPILGDVVFMGVDDRGESIDLPEEVAKLLEALDIFDR